MTTEKNINPNKRSMNVTRRSLLRTSAVGILGSVAGMPLVSAKKTGPDSTQVDFDDEQQVYQFLRDLATLTTEKKILQVVDRLDLDEKTICSKVLWERPFALPEHPIVQNRETIIHSDEIMTTEGISVFAIPTSYNDYIEGTYGGSVLYDFSHTIEWNFDGNSYSNVVSSFKGQSYNPLMQYDGPGPSSYNAPSNYFDWYRSGNFSEIFGGKFRLFIELRGDRDGIGTTLDKGAMVI